MVSNRILEMRRLLKDALVKNGAKGDWQHITNQIGMFSYTGMSKPQCEVLIDKWHIYLIKNGRISMAGVTTKNVEYLANAIKDAVATAWFYKQSIAVYHVLGDRQYPASRRIFVLYAYHAVLHVVHRFYLETTSEVLHHLNRCQDVLQLNRAWFSISIGVSFGIGIGIIWY